MTTSTIQTQLAHRSIRKFTHQAIDEATIAKLVDVARMASTSNHLQCVSIIRVQNPDTRQALMECCSNQVYVKTAPEFWVYCVDFHKHQTICPQAQTDYTEVLLIGATDVGIMAQNVLLAAESLGLGGVYIGSLRNQIERAAQLLNLPQNVIPLLGMCLGYPDQDPPIKPRLPASMMFFEETYQPFNLQQLADYDKQVADYYQQRSQVDNNWSKTVEKALSNPVRPHVLPFLQQQGFAKK